MNCIYIYIYWFFLDLYDPPPRIPVTTRIMIFLAGDHNLNLHLPLGSWVEDVDPKLCIPISARQMPMVFQRSGGAPLRGWSPKPPADIAASKTKPFVKGKQTSCLPCSQRLKMSPTQNGVVLFGHTKPPATEEKRLFLIDSLLVYISTTFLEHVLIIFQNTGPFLKMLAWPSGNLYSCIVDVSVIFSYSVDSWLLQNC